MRDIVISIITTDLFIMDNLLGKNKIKQYGTVKIYMLHNLQTRNILTNTNIQK